MTIHVKMLQEIAQHARAMADAMQAIADDCAQQLAKRRAVEENEETVADEKAKPVDMKPYDGETPFDEPKEEQPTIEQPEAEQAHAEQPKLTMVELRAFVAERSTPENRASIKAILNNYGVKKLTELDESQYRAVMDEVAKL